MWHLDVFISHFRWSRSPKTLNDPNWLTQIAELHKSPGKSYFGLDAAAIMWWRDRHRETSNFLAVKFCRRLRMCLWPFSISGIRHKRINKKGQNYFCDSTCSLHLSKIYTMYIYLFIHFIFWISDRFPENGGNRCGSAPGKECFSLKKTYICTTGFTLVVMGFCSPWKRQRETKVFTTFSVTSE